MGWYTCRQFQQSIDNLLLVRVRAMGLVHTNTLWLYPSRRQYTTVSAIPQTWIWP